jgi:hypothetical protein
VCVIQYESTLRGGPTAGTPDRWFVTRLPDQPPPPRRHEVTIDTRTIAAMGCLATATVLPEHEHPQIKTSSHRLTHRGCATGDFESLIDAFEVRTNRPFRDRQAIRDCPLVCLRVARRSSCRDWPAQLPRLPRAELH